MRYRISIMPKNQEILDSGIILSPDEVTMVSFNAADYQGNLTSKSESVVSLVISGMLHSSAIEKFNGNNLIEMETLFNEFTENSLGYITKGLKNISQKFSGTFRNSLNLTINNLFQNKTEYLSGDISGQNMKNSICMSKWALSCGEQEDYRDIAVEILINNNELKTYFIPDMYVSQYKETMGVIDGAGSFSLFLKQSKYSRKKIVIE